MKMFDKIAYVVFILIIALIVGFVYRMYQQDQRKAALYDAAQSKCLDAGYPQMKRYGARYFCMRKVNGSDVMLEVTP